MITRPLASRQERFAASVPPEFVGVTRRTRIGQAYAGQIALDHVAQRELSRKAPAGLNRAAVDGCARCGGMASQDDGRHRVRGVCGGFVRWRAEDCQGWNRRGKGKRDQRAVSNSTRWVVRAARPVFSIENQLIRIKKY